MGILQNYFRPYPCQQFTLELNDILSIFGEIVVTAFPFCHHIPCIAAAQINERKNMKKNSNQHLTLGTQKFLSIFVLYKVKNIRDPHTL